MTVSTPPIPADTPTIERLVERWARKYGDRITGYLRRPAQPARYADFPAELSTELREALERRGVQRLYSHQREAWDRVQAGEHVVVVTPTASGKTL
ncbi:MAG TPA: helicase, partial [Dokdonella sp.]